MDTGEADLLLKPKVKGIETDVQTFSYCQQLSLRIAMPCKILVEWMSVFIACNII